MFRLYNGLQDWDVVNPCMALITQAWDLHRVFTVPNVVSNPLNIR